jgi:uncharacterized membrane protein YedE/YeeE
MNIFVALLAGIVFGLGLIVSGMADPAKVQGFLDLFGQWDPTLAFVMGGAVLVTASTFRWVLRRDRPLFAAGFKLPGRRDVDARLVAGATLFGIGWGIGGFCPGPAITALATFSPAAFVFVAAMIAGMLLHDLMLRPRASIPVSSAA